MEMSVDAGRRAQLGRFLPEFLVESLSGGGQFPDKLSTNKGGFPQLFPVYPQGAVFYVLFSGEQSDMSSKRPSFDPRRHWQQTQVRLIVGGLAVLFVVGGGLVWWLYGAAAALTAIACLLAAASVLGGLWLILLLLERWVKEEEP